MAISICIRTLVHGYCIQKCSYPTCEQFTIQYGNWQVSLAGNKHTFRGELKIKWSIALPAVTSQSKAFFCLFKKFLLYISIPIHEFLLYKNKGLKIPRSVEYLHDEICKYFKLRGRVLTFIYCIESRSARMIRVTESFYVMLSVVATEKKCFYVHAGTCHYQKPVYINCLQKTALEKSFKENAYPTKATLYMLGEQIGLSESRVNRWFYSKRRCARRDERIQTLSIGENIIHVCTCNCTWYL